MPEMNTADKIAGRKQRWIELMSAGGAFKCTYIINVENFIPERPPLWREKKQERIEWIFAKYEKQLEMMNLFEDDMVPFLDMLTGTEIFAECFGSKVVYPANNTPFALPRVNNAKDAARIKKPKLEDTPLMFLFEMADEIRKRAGKDVLFGLPDIQSPMDISALIWDKNDFYIALLEEPEAVKYLSNLVCELLTEFFDEWFLRYGREFVAHFPDYYMPQGLTISVDEIGVVNDKMFEEYFLPELEYLSKHFGGLGIHCCANARHQWANFKKIPGLKMLNLVQPADVLMDAYKYFADHLAQMHCWYSEEPPWEWAGMLPPGARAAFIADAGSIDEARLISEKINLCGR